ncbi:hypothetical protein GCM10027063_24150 [Promicromonospora xylanilytica]
MTARAADLDEGVIEIEGMLWRPKPDAVATAEEFILARDDFMAAMYEGFWSPWRRDECRVRQNSAVEVMEQWDRAEPAHRFLTLEELEAEQATREVEREAERRADKQRIAEARHRYDPEREKARLSLLEHEAILAHVTAELSQYNVGGAEPSGAGRRRTREVEDLQAKATSVAAIIESLRALVGDPEEVVDAQGRLPRDRLQSWLWELHFKRESEVRQRREEITTIEAELKLSTDKVARKELRERRSRAARRLRAWDELPRQEAPDMCSECPKPMNYHGWTSSGDRDFLDGPCPAWPNWSARVRSAFQQIKDSAERERTERAVLPIKQEPLGFVKAGLSTGETVAQLQALVDRYPDSEVRKGRGGRLEVWPTTS